MRILALLTLMVPAIAGAAGVEIVNPIRGELPGAWSVAETDKVIRLAFLDLGWTIRKAAPGSVTADLDLRGRHQVTVEAKYDDKTVELHYVDSAGIEYEPCSGARYRKGAMCVHDNYHGWLQNVLKALPNARQKLELLGVIRTP